MKHKILVERFIFSDLSTAILLVTFIFICSLLSTPMFAASSSGNTTVYDYPTNVTLIASNLINFQCNASGATATLTADIDPYIGTNEKELIKVYYRMANGSSIEENLTDTSYENRTRVVLDFNSTHSHNLSYVGADDSWEFLISNNESDETIFLFKANSQSYQCINATYTTKFREAFYYTFHLYQGSNITESADTKPYKNDFQYLYLRFYNTSTSWTDSTMFKDMSYLDRIFKGMPFYKQSFNVEFDDTLTFWSRYNNGEARIKLYEAPMNYSLQVMTDDTYGLEWTDEFTKPQLQDYSWSSTILYKFRVDEVESKTIGVYLSRWEINKFLFLMNIGYWILILVIWFVLMLLISRAGIGAVIGFTLIYLTIAKLIGMSIF